MAVLQPQVGEETLEATPQRLVNGLLAQGWMTAHPECALAQRELAVSGLGRCD